MHTEAIYHWLITGLNVGILASLLISFRKHFLARKLDKNFHSIMLMLCTLLLLANTFAMITGIYAYFVYNVDTPELLTFGRFADRYCMMFAYVILNKISDRF